MSDAYEVAPIFLIRLAGLPFDIIEGLATPEASRTARDFIREGHRFERNEPSTSTLSASLERDLARARKSLHNTARSVLPAYLIFGADGMRERLESIWANQSENAGTLPPRNRRARERERHILLYLQRLAAKADTFSEFGPTGWGRVDDSVAAIAFAPDPGVAVRDAFFERWTAHAIAGAMNDDPDVFGELSPRLNPNARLEGNKVSFEESGDSIVLENGELDLLNRCDGAVALPSLGDQIDLVRALVARNILRCEVEVPALEPRALDTLLADVTRWRSSPVRNRWIQILQPLADLPRKFVAAGTNERQEILDYARMHLASVGAKSKTGGRSLYAATNPIAEECFRQCHFRINRQMIDEVTTEAGPWIDFWRDSYAFIASRVGTALRRVFEKTTPATEAIPLPRFFRACEMMNMSLTGAGLIAPAVIAFQEVKAAFAERLRPHIDREEYQLTIDDCHVIRQKLQYPPFDEYTYPSADLQISAESIDAVKRGEYEWIIAELHPAVALLQHAMYWACPDKALLSEVLARGTGGKPNIHFGFSAADLTAHTTGHFFDALPQLSYFVAPQRSHPEWQTVLPGQTEVYVDRSTGDVCLRTMDTGQHLGSFTRNWLIPLGFHPFQFGLAPHTPRLRCGNVIVQRQSWVVSEAEFPKGDYTGISGDLVVAMEKLRAQKKWPRYVYIRPTEQALRRSGAEGRDKDTKPVFIDLESYPFLEIFHRWLTKAGELEVTEMLPDPDHLLWKEPDGRRMFELRTLIVPRS